MSVCLLIPLNRLSECGCIDYIKVFIQKFHQRWLVYSPIHSTNTKKHTLS